WLPDCATGELAYALASLLHLYVRQRDHPPKLQIFATDSDPHAIEAARRMSNPQLLASAAWFQQLPDFFQHEHRTISVRGLITFAQPQPLRDPPFADLDLIVCANLLPTYSEEMQQRILHQFHWSLRPGGYLLLGSETDSPELEQHFVRHLRHPALFQRRGLEAHPPQRQGPGAPPPKQPKQRMTHDTAAGHAPPAQMAPRPPLTH